MHITLATPSLTATGNSVTASRWASIFRELGHDADIVHRYAGGPSDLLIALHAVKSAPSVDAFLAVHPDKPVVVALTGTDLYRDLAHSETGHRALGRATRLVALEACGPHELAPELQPKTRVVYQSAAPSRLPRRPRADRYQVCLLAHVRDEKDPLRPADAALELPPSSRIYVVHAGESLDEPLGEEARTRSASDPRYEWRGPLDREQTEKLLLESHLMVLSSKMEGGANVLSEALANDVPIVASRVPGIVGVLGRDYPGYFEVGDTHGLAALFSRAETDSSFAESLQSACRARAPLVSPERERRSWEALLGELAS